MGNAKPAGNMATNSIENPRDHIVCIQWQIHTSDIHPIHPNIHEYISDGPSFHPKTRKRTFMAQKSRCAALGSLARSPPHPPNPSPWVFPLYAPLHFSFCFCSPLICFSCVLNTYKHTYILFFFVFLHAHVHFLLSIEFNGVEWRTGCFPVPGGRSVWVRVCTVNVSICIPRVELNWSIKLIREACNDLVCIINCPPRLGVVFLIGAHDPLLFFFLFFNFGSAAVVFFVLEGRENPECSTSNPWGSRSSGPAGSKIHSLETMHLFFFTLHRMFCFFEGKYIKYYNCQRVGGSIIKNIKKGTSHTYKKLYF